MSAPAKKLHHFVPRFYLRAWAENDWIWCLQGGKILHPNIRNVGAENYFYRLQGAKPEDVGFLREAVIKDSPDGLKAVHEQLLHAFTLPHEAKRRLEMSGRATPVELAEIDRMIVELNENLHTGIEDDFQPYLAATIAGSLDFLDEPAHAATFYRGLAVQYARTNHIRQTRKVLDPSRRELYLRVANPLIHMVAINVGRSLYAGQKLT